ncbi:MAG: recombinase family protein [Bacteroidota bacterium]
MFIGYARVSTQDQNLDLQLTALADFGCAKVFQEKVSGKNTERPELKKLLAQLRAGDSVVVWKLDRLGRSIQDLISLVELFKSNDVNFVSITDSIDTSTAMGRFTFNIFASLAQFEREIIRERTNAGLSAARARGRKGGRPSGLSKEKIKDAEQIKILFDAGRNIEDIKKTFKVSQATIYRYVKLINERDAQAETQLVNS